MPESKAKSKKPELSPRERYLKRRAVRTANPKRPAVVGLRIPRMIQMGTALMTRVRKRRVRDRIARRTRLKQRIAQRRRS